MSPFKVVLAGATGNLGPAILRALLNADFLVTVLTRKGGNSAKLPKASNLTVAEVDYSDVGALTSILKGNDVVVSTISSAIPAGQNTVIDPAAKKDVAVVAGQNALIEAALAAGVRRFIPSEFGSNTSNPNTASLPTFVNKVATQKALQQISQQHPEFTYTLVHNGAFLDWGFQNRTFIDLPGHTIPQYNGGDVPFSASTLDAIGQAVVGIVQHQAETANRPVYIQSVLTTQNKLVEYAKEIDGKEWNIIPKDTETVKRESLAELAKGDKGQLGPARAGLVASAIFGKAYGNDYSAFLDNELLGVKQLTEQELKDLVANYV